MLISSSIMVLLVCLVSLVSCSRQIATEKKECFCSDGKVSMQDCRVDGRGCEPCECTEYSIWCDPDTKLCWQDPQREAFNYDDIGVTAKEAVQYCDELVLGGYDDWRVPTIAELRGLLAGTPETLPGGNCPVDDDCTFMNSWDPSCTGSTFGEGLFGFMFIYFEIT